MGYEIKLIIGTPSQVSKKIECGDLIIEDGEAYRPYKRDENGEFVKTDIDETYFMIAAQIDLCKIGYESHFSKILKKNTDKNREYFWYDFDGNGRISEDRYGDKSELLSINDCIVALKKDVESDDYRRFKWALALLESMKDSEMKVLWYGH